MTNERELELLTIRDLMRTETGRSLMWRSLQQTGIFDNDFSVDPLQNAYYSGQREHGAWLTKELREACDDGYLKMLKENGNGNG